MNIFDFATEYLDSYPKYPFLSVNMGKHNVLKWYTEKSGCLELTSRCLTMVQPSYIFSCNI